jgi:uncharacterized protein
VEFEWDEQKRQSNIEKHGIDFVRAREIWGGPRLEILFLKRNTEYRHVVIGKTEDQVLTVVCTQRGQKYRIISARPAHRKERESYRVALRRELA